MANYCAYPWQQMIIDLTGEVVPCCFWSGYGNQGKPLGNTNINTIEEIWNGDEYKKLRKANFNGELENHPCNNCLAYKWGNGSYPSFVSVGACNHEKGFCYLIKLPEEVAKINPDNLYLEENGQKLLKPNSSHQEIREKGLGSYSFWGQYLYYSSSDNSDPRKNGRSYIVKSPIGEFAIQEFQEDSKSGQNLELSELEFESGKEKLDAKPSMISLVSTSDCNIDCPNCSQNKVREASVQHRKETVPDILNYVPYLTQFIWHGGEPYLIKRFRDFIDNFDKKLNPNLTFGFTSNGTFLSDSELEKLKKFPFINASISCDSFGSESFKYLRKGANYNHVIRNILKAISIYQTPKVIFSVGMIVCKSNLLELPNNLQFAISNNIPLNLSPVVVYPFNEQLNVFEDFEKEVKGWEEAINSSIEIVNNAIKKEETSVMRINPLGMVKEISNIFNQAKETYKSQNSIKFVIKDPNNSLIKMNMPAIYFIDKSSGSIVAYKKLLPFQKNYEIRIPSKFNCKDVDYFYITNDIRRCDYYFAQGPLYAGWVLFSALNSTIGEINPDKIKVTIPKLAEVKIKKNISFSSRGETTENGLNIVDINDITNAVRTSIEKQTGVRVPSEPKIKGIKNCNSTTN